MAKILFGGIVGGIVVFLWGFVSNVFFVLNEYGIKDLPNEAGLAGALKADVPGPGLYSVPGRGMSTCARSGKGGCLYGQSRKGAIRFHSCVSKGTEYLVGRHVSDRIWYERGLRGSGGASGFSASTGFRSASGLRHAGWTDGCAGS